MSFIIPVIVFTLAYNVPKFFELTTKTRMVSEQVAEDKFGECVANIFHNTSNLTYILRNKSRFHGLSNQMYTNDFVSNSSMTRDEIFFVAEQSTKRILESCCNCTSRHFLDSSENTECNAYKISELILNLVEFLSDPEGRDNLESFQAVLNVRWNMQMTLFIQI